MSNDEELLKTVTKCLAKFTNHGCDNFVALQIQGEGQGFQRLVECCKLENRSIWEPALATLVNLSFIESLRPNLGNNCVQNHYYYSRQVFFIRNRTELQPVTHCLRMIY